MPSWAQDFHYSLYNTSPITINPGLTGVFDFDFHHKDIRVAGNYRNQWASIRSNQLNVGKAFQTTSISVDGIIKQHKTIEHSYLSAGLEFINDKSGDLGLQRMQGTFALSYTLALDKALDNFFTFGMNGSYSQLRVNFLNATYDNQWQNNSFNAQALSGESIIANNVNYLDFSAGFSHSYLPERGIRVMSGLALLHLLQPNQSFASTIESPLPRNLIAHSLVEIPISRDKYVVPNFLYQRQQKATELTMKAHMLIHFFEQNLRCKK